MQASLAPSLEIGRCIKDSLRVWARHLPVLFLASMLAMGLSVLTATFLAGSLYAGLLTMMLKAMRGDAPRIGDLFAHVRRFLRFSVLTWGTLFLTAIGLALLVVPGVLFGVRCFHVHLLVADRGASLDEAFVASRKAVKRYRFLTHLALILFAAFIVSLGISAAISYTVRILPVGLALALPLAVGLFASAYRQTLEIEAAHEERREQEFDEMRDELQTAHDMQMGLLPKQNLEVPGYSLDGVCIPANNVGGDHFTYRWLGEGETRLALVVADVSGKAMGAAVTALRFTEMLRYESEGKARPAHILEGLNRSLEGQLDPATFITCCIAVVDPVHGRVEIASAGHCMPYHYRHASGQAVPVQVVGYPLGMASLLGVEADYASVQIDLARGDALVLYSDGVVEAQNDTGELYDETRFELLLGEKAGQADAAGLVRTIVDHVERFVGDAPRTDDLTAVVLKRE